MMLATTKELTMELQSTSKNISEGLAGALIPEPDELQIWKTYGQEPISFEKAYAMVMGHHNADGEREDIQITALKSWAFGPTTDSKHMAMWAIPLPGRQRYHVALPIRKNAWSQLCGRLSLPADYVGRLPAKLQMACVNYDMSRNDKDAFARLAGGSVRALLSDRYAPMDDGYYLQVVADVLDDAGYRDDAVVRVMAAGPTTVMRVTLPNEARMVKGQMIEWGIDVANSELGLRSVQITPVTYNLVCTNGARAWKSQATHRMRHVGDPNRLKEALKDAVPVALAEASGDLDRWQKAADSMVDDALAEIESLVDFGFSKPEREMVGRQLVVDSALTGESLDRILNGNKTDVFAVANAVTATGRQRISADDDGNVTGLDARLRFEELGHEYLRRRTN